MKSIIISLLTALAFTLTAQQNVKFDASNVSDPATLAKALEAIKAGDEIGESMYPNFLEMEEYYEIANKINPNNAELSYKIAKCKLNNYKIRESLAYFENARKRGIEDKEFSYYYGRAQQLIGNYVEAKVLFEEYSSSITAYDRIVGAKDVTKRISECEAGIKAKSDTAYVKIYPLSNNINTKYHDHSPVLSLDGNVLYFTSKRDGAVGGQLDVDGQYMEDVYKASYSDGKWGEVQNVGKPINGKTNDASVAMTIDGKKMIICRDGDIFTSTFEKGKWSKPVPFPGEINGVYHESTACFSYDGNKLYFVSNKFYNSRGGTDIYYCEKQEDGSWGAPSNVAENVNSKYNEDFVFLHPDGKTMYFASKGHASIGGYDIFKTVLQKDGTWSDPENLGYPINSPADEVSFTLSPDGKKAFVASTRAGGLGFSDIYVVEFLGEKPPKNEPEEEMVEVEMTDDDSDAPSLTIIEGYVHDSIGKKLPIEAEVIIVDNTAGEIISSLKTSKEDGKFIVSLPSGKDYALTIKKDGYLFHSENFNIPEEQEYMEIKKDIALVKIEKDMKIVLRNVFFEYGSSTLQPQSYRELDRVIKILQENPKLKVEISGHTDNQSSRDFNMKLSEERAKSVVNYLAKDIPLERMSSVGYAFDQPIADNDTEEGKAQNRRVEFKIVSVK